ncbi:MULTISPECIES: enolase C-terminal domain-like protein [unclassified Actinopolyspora]|uniref:enolase C-terminal domain-like protein n=1 Tax=unclassified Actinopolyspora TaxID=2639451 RepID=UPI0013F692FA|nr:MULTISPECIES: enolase C-terminal domain-like protein [unclassified Actinopolyspora]NHD19529.1 glucarate dehydratase [Actinopolyspora sp. BKK2]NHE78685.1 glucarate dehydratase [Actinopolyspora sp. BKK1]
MDERSMLVSEVRVTPILMEDAPLLNRHGVHQPYATRCIIEIRTEGGVVGLGESYGDQEYLDALRLLAEHLPGHSVTAPNRLWELAAEVLRPDAVDPRLVDEQSAGWLFGRANLSRLHGIAVSAFEVALLDALGRTVGLPVHALLGGKVRDRVDYAAYLFYRWDEHPTPGTPRDDWPEALDPAGVVGQAERMVDEYGFRSLKLKGGVFPPEEEVAAVEALREAFPERPVRLDPNGIWSVETSARVADELRGVVEYLEDPCLGVSDMAQVHRRTGVPLATNMCVTTPEDVPGAFAAEAVQILLCDHHFWGGLVATQQLAAICRTHGVGLSMHSNTHLGISLAAMTQAAACVRGRLHACDTHRPWQGEDVVTRPHRFVEGAVAVSDEPGLGVELDREALDRLHRRWLDSDVRGRDDVAAMRAADPEWTMPPAPRW